MSVQSPTQCDSLKNDAASKKVALDRLMALALHSVPTAELQQRINAADDAYTSAQDALDRCIVEHIAPVFASAPVADTPTVNPDQTPTTVNKNIPLSLLQAKFDELFNKRTDIPLFKIRLDHFSAPGGGSPNSSAEVSFIDPSATNAKPVYSRVIFHDFGVLTLGLYLNNLNSKLLTLNIDTSQQAPIELKVIFDCTGDCGVKSSTVLPDTDFTEFNVSIRLTLTNPEQTKIDLLSWVAEFANIKRTPLPPSQSAQHPIRATGVFLNKRIDEQFESEEQCDAFFADQVVKVHIKAGRADPGDTVQGYMRDQIFQLLCTNGTAAGPQGSSIRDGFNSRVVPWLLGSDGNFVSTTARIENDTLRLVYQVPANVLTPFRAPADWPGKRVILSGQPRVPQRAIDFSQGALANIDHIVVLTMENRSFDQMLGYLSLPVDKGGMGRTDVDGLNVAMSNPYNGVTYPVFPFAPGNTLFAIDPNHGTTSTAHQIDAQSSRPQQTHFVGVGGEASVDLGAAKMDGFVRSFAEEPSGAAFTGTGAAIMGYHTTINVPTHDALTRDFAISHRWFAAHPGPTFCNRFFELTGYLNRGCGLTPFSGQGTTSKGVWEFANSSPLTPVFTPTIFDHLTAANIGWNYFEHGYCFLRFFSTYTFDNKNIFDSDDPTNGFFAKAQRGDLPAVTFIDPHFVELAPGGNCDGPPADVADGQNFVQRVVEAVVAGPQWPKTLLLIVYDEHGGFFDHVPPPPAVAPALSDPSAYPIKTLGVRVPAFIISPYVQAGAVFGHDGAEPLVFDHTSILKTIVRRFLGNAPPYMGERYAAAKDLASVLGNTARQSQFLPFIRYRIQQLASQMQLDVQFGSPKPGTIVWQYSTNGTSAQDYSFEDAGNGFVYIRTHCGNLYLTANVVIPGSVQLSGQVQQPTPAGSAVGVKQDSKYPASAKPTGLHPGETQVAALNPVNPDYQRWRLTPVDRANNTFTITNAFFPDRPLQPDGRAAPEVRVALASGGGTSQAWVVTTHPIEPTRGRRFDPVLGGDRRSA